MRVILAISIAALALTACARSETPEQARLAAERAQAEFDRIADQSRAANGEDEDIVAGMSPGQIDTSGGSRLTPGSWSATEADGERMARFGEDGQAPRITIACELGGGIDIQLIGMVPQGGSETVYISSPEGGSTFTASESVSGTQAAYISVPASDPFIGRVISGNGPFSLRLGSAQRLTFPASEELTSVVSACDRRDRSATAGAAAAEGTTTPAATPSPAQ